MIWRWDAIRLRMPDSDAEVILRTGDEGFEVDLLVASADEAAQRIVERCHIFVAPFDIAIGRCVVISDP